MHTLAYGNIILRIDFKLISSCGSLVRLRLSFSRHIIDINENEMILLLLSFFTTAKTKTN